MPYDNPVNLGVRTVDNKSQPLYFPSQAAPAGTYLFGKQNIVTAADLVDTQGYVSYRLYLANQVDAGSTPLALNPTLTSDISIEWFDDISSEIGSSQFSPVLVAAEAVELQALLGTSSQITQVPLLIRNQTLARYMRVSLPQWWGTPVNPEAYGVLQLSSVALNGLQLVYSASPTGISAAGADGYVARTGGLTIAAGAAAPLYYACPTLTGTLTVAINGNSTGAAGANCRLRGGFGALGASVNELTITTGSLQTLNNPTTLYTFPVVPNRPFIFNVANIGSAAGVFNVECYTTGA